MTTHEPGTVHVAKVAGAPDVRVMRVNPGNYPWRSASGAWREEDVTDVRPLVVLDLGDDTADAARQLRQFNRAEGGAYCFWIRDKIADQIEAQTKPPRIPEPGFWGVVEARYSDTEPRTFVRGRNGWASVTDPGRAGVQCDWHCLVDPVLVRDGIEESS